MISKLVQSVAVSTLLCLLVPGFAFAQQAKPDEASAPAEAAETRPIPAGQIAERALDVGNLLRSAALDSEPGGEVEAIRADASSTKRQVDELQDETRRRLQTGGPVSLIEESEKEWSRLQSRLDRWLKALSSRADAVGSVLQRVRAEKARWVLTRDALSAEETPPELVSMIGEVLEAIEKTEQQVRSSRDSLINLQVSVGDAKSLADEILADQREEIRERNRNIIHRDSEPLWAAFGKEGEGGGLLEEVAAARRDNYGSLQKYVPERKTRLLSYLFALVALVAGLIYLRRKAQVWVQQDRSLESALPLLERPVAAGFILVALFADLLDPDAPRAWSAVLGLLLLFALLRLLPRILVATGRSWAYILVVLFFLQQTAKLTPDGTVLHRLVLLLLSLAGFGASVWLVRKMRPGRSDISSGWLQVIRVVARVAAVAFVVGAVANVTGAVGFAMVVVTGTLRAIFGAVILLVAATLMRALVRGAMLLPSVRRLGIVSQRGETTRKTLFRAITVLAVIVWVVVTLQGFNALDPLLDSLGALVEMKISIGEMTLTPGNALIFALVIWISFKVARFIPFALEADILPHMKLQRGVPAAVTKLTRYALIVIGVIIAFSAAGFPFDRITIIFGALSVGIGFGLQNVVSNFVSGLILLFERPIQVGDRIQLTEIEGVVMDIGMRASTIRSYSGADIVVPNANLISAEVVNWTLRDRTRRMEIRVGVAYGTDPRAVIGILEETATKHPQVDDHPKPEAIFLDFGESSLDFQLRAWTAAGRHLGVGSELRVAIAEALHEAGITIPFPQRDLHLRTVDGSVNFP